MSVQSLSLALNLTLALAQDAGHVQAPYPGVPLWKQKQTDFVVPGVLHPPEVYIPVS
jgi:hypothetical protein